MAGKYIESQTPIMQNGDFYYPPTTAKQVILPDGRRMGSTEGLNITADDVNALSIDVSEYISGEGNSINANSLGGIAASEYSTTTELETQFIKVNIDNPVFGEVAMSIADRANLADKATEADNASKLENKTINELFAMMFEVEHPVGSLYLSMSETDDPNTKWNVFGISCGWELVKDVFLLGAGNSYTLCSTGGETEHTLTVDEMPSHDHMGGFNDLTVSDGTKSYARPTQYAYSAEYKLTLPAGGSQPHNNMPPYIATNIWKRIS